MTTEKHNLPDAYFNVQQPDVDTIRVSRHDSERYGLEAIVYFGDDVNMHVRTVAKARELLAAAFETLRILDPDGAVICRATNRDFFALEEIMPGRAPGLVIPPADEQDDFVQDRHADLDPNADEADEQDAPYPGFPERYPSGADSHMTEDGSLPDVARAADLRPTDAIDCDACNILALRCELDPVAFATSAGVAGIRWVCRDLTGCTDRVAKASTR